MYYCRTVMANSNEWGNCSQCNQNTTTYHYHGSNLEKIELCKQCYDQYLAKQMVQYWKDHIAEEERRSSN